MNRWLDPWGNVSARTTSDTDRDKIISDIEHVANRWKLEMPLTLALEILAPSSHFLAQGISGLAGYIAPLLPGGVRDLDRITAVLANPENVRMLIDRLNGATDAARQR